MSDYTVTLKRVCDVYGKNEVLDWFKSYSLSDYLTEEQIATIESLRVFSKNTLAEMILNHYLFSEIAYETPEMFSHFAKTKLKEIMGSYAMLIYSASISFNPFDIKTISIKETLEKTRNLEKTGSETSTQTNGSESTLTNNNTSSGTSQTSGDSNSSSYNNASSLNVASDTPQGQISKQQILNGNYASSTSANESESEIQDFTHSTSSNNLSNIERKTQNETLTENLSGNKNLTDNSSENEEYVKMREGYDFKKTKSELIAEYRKNIINVYEKIIEDLRPLFFALY